MESDEDTSPSPPSPPPSLSTCDFQPFKRNSVNLIPAPTNSGKSYLIAHLIRHRHIYFAGNPIGRVIYVYCNPSSARFWLTPPSAAGPASPSLSTFASPSQAGLEDIFAIGGPETAAVPATATDDEIEIIHLRLEDFSSPETFLREQDLVVFEDVHLFHPSIELTVDVYSHHLNLCATFIICQALIAGQGKQKLSPLLNLVHNVLLLFNSTAATRYFKYILNYFFHDDDLKAYLKQILSFGQRYKQAAWLEVNSVASQPSKHLAITSLNRLADAENPHCFCHPQPFAADKLLKSQEDCFAHMDVEELAHAPPNTFILVPAKNVVKVNNKKRAADGGDLSALLGDGSSSHKCAAEEKWDQVNEIIESRIEGIFDHAKWRKAKNLAVDILSNPELCVSDDGKWLMMRQGEGKHHLGVNPISLSDFLLQCTKQQGPNQHASGKLLLYRKFVKLLLSNGTPADLIKNKGLLAADYGGANAGRRGNRQSLSYKETTPPLQPQWIKAKDRTRKRMTAQKSRRRVWT
jgi:hypothetical protein